MSADSSRWRLDWPVSGGRRVASALLKSTPSDFQVNERLWPALERDAAGGHHPGEGEHLCVRLQKTGDNTEYVARQLTGLAGLRSQDVGFCGLKDRHAVTTQWFSLHRPGREMEDPALLEAIAGYWPVLASTRQPGKLRRGDHLANGFRLVLRDIKGERSAVEQALERLALQGAPNYFGPQRFGHHGQNLDRALAMDPTRLNRKRGRGGRGPSKNVLYFSAARSWLFNEVLAERVRQGNWRVCLPGEPAPAPLAPSGPLWGDGGTTATEAQEVLEREVVANHEAIASVFGSTRMKPERRALVAHIDELQWWWSDDQTLTLEFALPPGQYATTILADVFDVTDVSLLPDNNESS